MFVGFDIINLERTIIICTSLLGSNFVDREILFILTVFIKNPH